ncbi:MFS transporter [Nocardioides luteus]|uniref:MFS transporter n=1 Tax=Nocardioides luteus TaxID=1844 RepID=A0A1J4N9C5_9ACTN|nr:MFS transporter [Nocardioides luteus]OIJ28098.1 MFS transporter [Nocardioides luteus]
MTVAADETSTREPAAPPAGSVRALLAALLGFTVITVDVSAVNIALPYLHRDLGGGMAGLQWVVDAYTLMFAALMLSAGAVTDRIGPVRAYGLGVVLFTAASLACAAAPVMPVLIAARVFQGAAAALVMPASLALVRVAYDDARARAQAIAVWTIGGSAAMALGPVAGGLLSEYAGWRWVFLVNVPIGILIVALLAGLRIRSMRHRAPLDLPGQVLAVVALSALTYAVIEAGHTGWHSGALLAGATSVAAALAFVVVEHRSAAPVLPLGLLARGRVAVALVSGFGINFGFYGGIFLLGLYYQQVRGWTGAEAGLMFVVPAALTTCANMVAPRLAQVVGRRPLIVGGQLILAVAMLVLLPLATTTPVWLVLVLLVPLATGGALAITLVTADLIDAVEPARVGVATGALSTFRQTGGAIAVAVFGGLAAGATGILTLPGMRACLLVGGVVLVLTAVVAAGGARKASSSG